MLLKVKILCNCIPVSALGLELGLGIELRIRVGLKLGLVRVSIRVSSNNKLNSFGDS